VDEDAIIKGLSRGSDRGRYESAAQVAALEPPPVDFLLGHLRSEDWRLTEGCIIALGMIGDKRAVPALLGLLHYNEAVLALGRIGDPAALPGLAQGVESRQESVQKATAEALERFGHAATPFIIPYLKSQYAHAREAALWILGYIRDPAAIPHVLECLGDRESGVHSRVSWALGANELEPSEYGRLGAAGLAGCVRSGPKAVRVATIGALGCFGKVLHREPAMADPLFRAAGDRDPEIRDAAVSALRAAEFAVVLRPSGEGVAEPARRGANGKPASRAGAGEVGGLFSALARLVWRAAPTGVAGERAKGAAGEVRRTGAAERLNEQGVSALEAGKEEEGLQLLDEALEADSGYLEAVFNKRLALFRQGRLREDGLGAPLPEARGEERSRRQRAYLMGLLHLEGGRFGEALELLGSAWEGVAQPVGIEEAMQAARAGKAGEFSPKRLQGNTDGVDVVAISAEGKWAVSGGWDKSIRLWDLANGTCAKVFQKGARVRALGISADGLSGFWGCDATAWRISLDLGKEVVTFRMPRSPSTSNYSDHSIVCLVVSPDNRYLVCGSCDSSVWASKGGTVEIWDAASGQHLRTMRGHVGPVTCVAVSRDGRLLVSGSDHLNPSTYPRYDQSVRLWDVEQSRCVRELEIEDSRRRAGTTTAGFSADGSLVLAGDRAGAIRVWETRTGELRWVRMGSKRGDAVAGYANGRWFAAMDSGDEVCLVDWATGGRLKVVARCLGVAQLAVSLDGRTLVAGCLTGEVWVVNLRGLYVSPWSRRAR
jgi:HEAT repeat protein